MPESYRMQTEEGQPQVTVRQMSQLEAVLGTRARSGQQFDAFDASYGPAGTDGYPRRLWDRRPTEGAVSDEGRAQMGPAGDPAAQLGLR